jgi:hypothetical protein
MVRKSAPARVVTAVGRGSGGSATGCMPRLAGDDPRATVRVLTYPSRARRAGAVSR